MGYFIIILFGFLIICLFLGLVNLLEIGSKTGNSYSDYKRQNSEKPRPDHTGFIPYTKGWKEQHMTWANEGKCYNCGAPSGEEQGICDKCRWS